MNRGNPDPSGGVDLRHHGDADLRPGLVDLAVNVRAGTPPRWLADRLVASLGDIAGYPDPGPARVTAARRHGVRPENVLPTAGAAEAFVLLARVLAPRRAVVVHPQFTEPEQALRAAGHPVQRTILSGDFTLDPAAVPAEADLVVIGNPTNPTSVLHPAATIAALARPGRTLVVDEAFADAVPGEPESLAGAVGDLPGLVVVRSLTKTWGLAGLRAGYLLGAESMVRELGDAQPLWPVSAPALVAIQACCSPAALAEAQTWARGLGVRRDHLAARLAALPGVQVMSAARAPFLLVRVPEGARTRAALADRGYAVRRGDTFPGLGQDWIRVAVRDLRVNSAFAATLHDVLRAPTPGAGRPGRTRA